MTDGSGSNVQDRGIGDGPLLCCSGKGVHARGTVTAEGFRIVDGTAVVALVPSVERAVSPFRAALIASGAMVLDGDVYRFMRAVDCTSSSLAAKLVLGCSRSGPNWWRTSGGMSLGELQSIDAALAADAATAPAPIRADDDRARHVR